MHSLLNCVNRRSSDVILLHPYNPHMSVTLDDSDDELIGLSDEDEGGKFAETRFRISLLGCKNLFCLIWILIIFQKPSKDN